MDRNAGFHDADGDTMMDEWELYYSGSATGVSPYGNPDGDAYPNLAEYFASTHPQSRDPYSGYSALSMAGSFNGWSTTARCMTLAGDHVWQCNLWRNAGTSTFKFAANGAWDVNWGDNSQASGTVPFWDTADADGDNITLIATMSATVTVTFNDLTRKYAAISYADDSDLDGIPDAWETARYTNIWAYGASDDPDGDGWANVAEYLEDTDPFVKNAGLTTNTSVNVAGNFSGWNTVLHPMQPAGNHLWALDLAFTNLVGAEFKFVANGNWSTAWGGLERFLVRAAAAGGGKRPERRVQLQARRAARRRLSLHVQRSRRPMHARFRAAISSPSSARMDGSFHQPGPRVEVAQFVRPVLFALSLHQSAGRSRALGGFHPGAAAAQRRHPGDRSGDADRSFPGLARRMSVRVPTPGGG